MATNVRFIRTLSGGLVLPAANVEAAIAIAERPASQGNVPDQWPLMALCAQRDFRSRQRARGKEAPEPPVADVRLDRLLWCGDYSAFTWIGGEGETLPAFLALTTGTAEFLVVWEDGELTGLRVNDGKLVQADVVCTLVPRTGTVAAEFRARSQEDAEAFWAEEQDSLYPEGPEDDRLL